MVRCACVLLLSALASAGSSSASVSDALEPSPLSPLDLDETSVAAGVDHSCAIHTASYSDVGGRVLCWGLNSGGQSSAPPGHFVQVSAGRLHTCALRLDETLECWGAGAPTHRPDGLFEQVSSGDFHACGVLKDKSLRCWGEALCVDALDEMAAR